MLRILQNDGRRNHGQLLKNWFTGSSDVFIAVAFLKATGWRVLAENIESFLGRGGRMRLLVGTDFYLTEPAPLRELFTLGTEFPALDWRLVDSVATSTFHPKYYRFRSEKWLWVMTGSANLTAGGLTHNIETSVIIEDGIDGALAKECEKAEAALWSHPRNRLPNEVLIGSYAAAFNVARQCAEDARDRAEKTLMHQPKVEGKRLEDELAAYRGNQKHQADLRSRHSNYMEAMRLIRNLLSEREPAFESFAAIYGKLVGERQGDKLWHSGSVYRSKTKVLNQWQEVMSMLREIESSVKLAPAKMYTMGETWIKKIHGIGPNIFTEFCHTLDPKRFSPLNNNPVTSLRWLGVDYFPHPSAFNPEDYGRFCRCMDRLRERCDLANLGEADHFLNFIYWRHKDEAEDVPAN
ncbi:phospholipase D-like domain-containing protein [Ereboglobus luteus]|uniref:Phospholipase D-like domain-containing protein n=1 Tax=Ereboglobus luteus TaxID=1796921 RepID=A0A2U8E205_9BACT|nr:phospholipase D-like domain-containing protein [Ereboglobus luteus]AWI08897.1 hypothetical protein CKA38_06200 [Ereboglobus luteus]